MSKVNTLLLELKNDNADLYRVFETSLIAKFDLFKSDIIVENRKIVNDTTNIIAGKISSAEDSLKNSLEKGNDNIISKINEDVVMKFNIKIDKIQRQFIILISSIIGLSIIGIIAALYK